MVLQNKGSDMLNVRPRAAMARPDRRLLAIGDMLSHAATSAARPGADAADAADTMIAVAADVYALSYGCDGALAVPAGVRVLARVAAVLARAAGDVPGEASNGGRHVAA